jgi:dimeric dUTPase (all-alpha-NTP-PPase superfamily)
MSTSIFYLWPLLKNLINAIKKAKNIHIFEINVICNQALSLENGKTSLRDKLDCFELTRLKNIIDKDQFKDRQIDR